MDLGVHARLAHATRDELRELRSAVEDQDATSHQNFHSAPVELDELDVLGLEVEDRAGWRSPYSQPQASPGFTIRVSPRSSSPAGA
jgi:hypothetical protein